MIALNQKDFYKTDHRRQYPDGTELVYSNFTPRSDRLFNGTKDFDGKIVWFGMQRFIKDFLIEEYGLFFGLPKEMAVSYYKNRLDRSLGPDAVPMDHIEDLHDLGYLPLHIKSLPEGSLVPMRVPVLTIVNTKPEFYWLVNDLETVMSTELWKPTTVATIAYQYRKLLDRYAEETGAPKEFVPLQGHDFSMRGMSGRADAANSGMGHLLSFIGTDTIPAIDGIWQYYNGVSSDEIDGCSVPATEHSVMCMGTKDDEIGTFKRLINDLYPIGIVSIVSDTWDFWKVVTEYVSELKDDIMARQPITDPEGNVIVPGKTVIRPDSGDPVKVICGYTESEVICEEGKVYEKLELPLTGLDQITRHKGKELSEPEVKGAVQCLWDVFGGTITEKGYKVLDEHIGLIYGDSITLDRAERILEGLKAKGFASCNVVFGIGSYTYQFNTRDTFGFAMKATYGEVNGEGREIFKDPITDSGTKKSAKGLLRVEKEDGEFVLYDQQTKEQETMGALQSVFLNGELIVDESFTDIRERLLNGSIN